MMLKKLIHTLIAALFILSADVCLLAAPPAATIQKAKTMIEQARQHLPIKGYGISLTEVSYDSSTYTLVYRYDYTLPVTKPTPASIKETKIGGTSYEGKTGFRRDAIPKSGNCLSL